MEMENCSRTITTILRSIVVQCVTVAVNLGEHLVGVDHPKLDPQQVDRVIIMAGGASGISSSTSNGPLYHRMQHVPWRDWHEWQQVYNGLFHCGNDMTIHQQMLQRMACWKARHNELPIAIETTWQLVELFVHEQMSDNCHHLAGQSTRSFMELSMVYATTVVRCVNGLVDAFQRGTFAMAVSQLAQKIGIPLWIVDLRHESTHNQLPSLQVLRFAAQHLMQWLRVNYWDPQDQLLRHKVHQTACCMVQFASRGDVRDKSDAPPGKKSTPNSNEDDGLPIEVADCDTLRNVVVPLLVNGHQYGHHVHSRGLLLTNERPATLDTQCASSTPTKEHTATISDSDAKQTTRRAQSPDFALLLKHWLGFLVVCQRKWVFFTGLLLQSLLQHVLWLSQRQHQQEPALHAEQAEELRQEQVHEVDEEMELLMAWIEFCIGNGMREAIKYDTDCVQEIYQSGALFVVKHQHQMLRHVFIARALTLLKSCKGVRQAVASLEQETLEEVPVALGNLEKYQQQLDLLSGAMEEDESSDIDVDAVHSHAFAHEEPSDAQEDPMLCELDMEHDQRLEQILQLQQTIVQEIVAKGQSAHSKLIPSTELQRMQDEIEIW